MFVTSEGHACARFRRALERRALWAAEDAARELPNLPLEDALQLVHLLRRARITEVREGGTALAHPVSHGGNTERTRRREGHSEPREASGRRLVDEPAHWLSLFGTGPLSFLCTPKG